jgi:phosphate acetyltransferase
MDQPAVILRVRAKDRVTRRGHEHVIAGVDQRRRQNGCDLSARIIEKLQRHPKRVVFPEGTEPRVLQAARQFYSLRLGAPVLLGDRTQVKQAAAELNVSLEGVRIINPAESEDLPAFIKRFELLRRFKGVEEKEARETMLNPNYYGAMMLAMHQVDGFISGANQSSGSVLRPLFQIVKVAPEATTASSCMVMEVEDTRFGTKGCCSWAIAASFPNRPSSNWPISPSRRPT